MIIRCLTYYLRETELPSVSIRMWQGILEASLSSSTRMYDLQN